MAKLKNAVHEETAEQIKETEMGVVNTKTSSEEATETEAKDVKTSPKVSVSDEVPEFADKILRMYPKYAKLAIDAQGGVYTEESQHLAKGKAILYQNPYYKH